MNRLVSVTLACALLTVLMFPRAAIGAESEAWQITEGTQIVIVEGDRAYATRVAFHIRQLQATARWLMNWPAAYHPTQALIYLLREDTVRDRRLKTPAPYDVHVDPYTPVGASIATSTLDLVVAPRGSERAVEFVPLHNLYGRMLIDQSPAARDWPACPRLGFATMLTIATIRDRDRLFIDGEVLAARESLSPAEFLDPVASPPKRQSDADQRAYACYLLANRVVVATPEEREAYQNLFAGLSANHPLIDSVPPALGGTIAEFTARFRSYAAQRLHAPAGHNRKAVLPDLDRDPPERLAALLRQVCSRLSRCPPDR